MRGSLMAFGKKIPGCGDKFMEVSEPEIRHTKGGIQFMEVLVIKRLGWYDLVGTIQNGTFRKTLG